ncbi:hypothetical protein ACO0K9_10545 [Undibacterium sp. Ji50W]|uniref:hypothetical protein n=1 Tax=Undibacterium sp. Ji50W TaxID=3413041 RepID=UPI003BF16AC3
MIRTALRWLVFFSVWLLVISIWRRDILPPTSELNSVLLNEPVQTEITQKAFQTTRGGVTYTVQPLYDYDLVGLVVSKHDANAWWDYLHREWNDNLNVVDLCVVWGKNVKTGAYGDLNFSSGQFTCNYGSNSMEAFAAFDETAISNNHLLTDQTRLAKIMQKVRVGDQIHFRGRLSEYSHRHKGMAFKRGTSIVRTDTGNGACETVFVESFEIIKSGGQPWRSLVWVAAIMLVASIVGWFMQPVRFNNLKN